MKRKDYLWLPYVQDIKLVGNEVRFVYKGGKVTKKWSEIHSIMLYGKHIPLEQEFLEKVAFFNIPLVIHRRNMPRAVWINQSFKGSKDDILTKQILYREKVKKQLHIARKLLEKKFKSMNWVSPPPRANIYRITSIDELRNLEAIHAKQYWADFYERLGVKSQRRGENEIAKILDAVSKFVSSIELRWILYHGLSPYHGYLHIQTNYPALVYDLMEPYRGIFDKVVFKIIRKMRKKHKDKDGLLGAVINAIKEEFDRKVYVHSTRQIVTLHELLHGIVLALKAYLQGEANRFIVPYPSKPNGGRPVKAGFKLYGHSAGVTDFWTEAKVVYEQSKEMVT